MHAAGDGRVSFAGRRGGYGNAIVLAHTNSISTLYGHMSRFARNLRVGTHVQQGDVIGYVGMTGLATGPHLHYEYLVNGVHKNPQTVQLPGAEPLRAEALHQFLRRPRPFIASQSLRRRNGAARPARAALNAPAAPACRTRELGQYPAARAHRRANAQIAIAVPGRVALESFGLLNKNIRVMHTIATAMNDTDLQDCRSSTSTANCRSWSSTSACWSRPRTAAFHCSNGCKFLCISCANLDEFFEIRVASLKELLEAGAVQGGPGRPVGARAAARRSARAPCAWSTSNTNC